MTTDKNKRLFQVTAEDFKKIPGSPIAYWVSDKFLRLFSESKIADFFEVKAGICTGDNANFIFFWHEIDFSKCRLKTKDYLYSPHNKGGEFCKWYGNRDFVLKYNQDSLNKMAENVGFRHDGKEYYFSPHVGWSKITSGKSSFRFYDSSFTFDSAGLGLFNSNIEDIKLVLALLNSKMNEYVIAFLNPTLNVTPIIIKQLPFNASIKNRARIINLVDDCINMSREDYNSFETSWDFVRHPLAVSAYERKAQLDAGLCHERRAELVSKLSVRFEQWSNECDYRFNSLKNNEEELNRIFIDIYGLQDELTPEVDDKDVTVRKAELGRDIRSLLSYAVGCMFGRYSLDVDGLAYAGGEWDASKYSTFPADADNIIPICDDDYFEDDLTGRFVKFIETVYGKETLEENLNFIAHALGGRGAAREVIRSYFRNDFFEEHCKIYQKRPIYWLFDSGKKGGFRALMYMHRYQPDTIAKLRVDYVHEQQERYRTAISDLSSRVDKASSSEKVKLSKQLGQLRDQAEEVRLYEEKIHHLADMMIRIDLDDGVKHNYAIFQDVLTKIK